MLKLLLQLLPIMFPQDPCLASRNAQSYKNRWVQYNLSTFRRFYGDLFLISTYRITSHHFRSSDKYQSLLWLFLFVLKSQPCSSWRNRHQSIESSRIKHKQYMIYSISSPSAFGTWHGLMIDITWLQQHFRFIGRNVQRRIVSMKPCVVLLVLQSRCLRPTVWWWLFWICWFGSRGSVRVVIACMQCFPDTWNTKRRTLRFLRYDVGQSITFEAKIKGYRRRGEMSSMSCVQQGESYHCIKIVPHCLASTFASRLEKRSFWMYCTVRIFGGFWLVNVLKPQQNFGLLIFSRTLFWWWAGSTHATFICR